MAITQYYGTGRRKSSVARVYLRPGNGKITAASLDSSRSNQAYGDNHRGQIDIVFADGHVGKFMHSVLGDDGSTTTPSSQGKGDMDSVCYSLNGTYNN